MLTRCPGCAAVFRITPEQLRARAGKVRCGKCQTVFNALDSLEEPPAAAEALPPPLPPAPPPEREDAVVANAAVPAIESPPATDADLPHAPALPEAAEPDATEIPVAVIRATPRTGQDVPPPEPDTATAPSHPVRPDLAEPPPPATADGEPPPDDGAVPRAPADATPEAAPPPPPALPEALATDPETVRRAAKAAGLVAARETTDIPGYDKWAEGTLTAAGVPLAEERRPRWPFVVACTLLCTTLAAQLAHHYRSELAVLSPATRPWLEGACALLDCTIPLPRHVREIGIEASDLQSDPGRNGMLVLSATLKNRAPYAQAWPLLELTLTDTQDQALLRRVLEPADYLPRPVDASAFPAQGDVALRLWLEADGIAAAGYRLYVFYP